MVLYYRCFTRLFKNNLLVHRSCIDVSLCMYNALLSIRILCLLCILFTNYDSYNLSTLIRNIRKCAASFQVLQNVMYISYIFAIHKYSINVGFIDPCNSSPCNNGGVCKKTNKKEYACNCKDKYTGNHCESEYYCCCVSTLQLESCF